MASVGALSCTLGDFGPLSVVGHDNGSLVERASVDALLAMSGRFLKLASWNVNGLRAITGGGKTPLTDLLQQCDHPDVLCLQETRLSSQPDGVAAMKLLGKSVPGYESFWNTCSSRGGYAGVAIFVREGLATAAYDWFPEPCDCAQCAVLRKEGRVMIVELGELVLVNVYVPNGGKEKGSGNGDADELPLKTEFLRQLKCTCETFSKQGRPCIVVGDLYVAHVAFHCASVDADVIGAAI